MPGANGAGTDEAGSTRASRKGASRKGPSTTGAGPVTQASPPDPAVALPVRPGVIIGILVVSAFVMILNETIVSVALEHLTVDLGVTATTVQWLTSGFLLTMGVVIPTTGYILQRFTPRQVFLAAISLFTVGTLICALAPGFPVLLAGRVVQASGTAVMIPLLMTTVMTLIPAERRGAMMGTITIVIAVAPAIGPTIGGFILASLDWRWMFWIVLPLSVAALVLGAVLMRLDSETRSTPLDPFSVLLSAIGFSGVVYGFSAIGEAGRGGQSSDLWIPIAALVIGVAGVTWFVRRQVRLQRTDRALLDMRPFSYQPFRAAVTLAALVFMSLLGAGAILLPIYLQRVVGVDAATTGLAVLPGGLVLGLMGRPIGRLFDKVGSRPLVIPGSIGLAVSLWLFAALGSGAVLGVVIAVHVLLMASLGLMMTPLIAGALDVLPAHLYSHGSAIMTTLQQVAGAAGIAALVTVTSVASAGGGPDATGLRAAFMVAGVLGLVAIVVAFRVRGKSAPTPATGTDETTPHDDTPPGPSSGPGLRGQVRADGSPIEAVLTLIDTDGRQHGRAATHGGAYRLRLPGAGVWHLVASAPGHAPRADRVLVEAGVEDLAHDVVLVPSARAAETRTADGSGSPENRGTAEPAPSHS